MENKLYVSSSPHINNKESVKKIMWGVFFSLLPAGVWGVYAFGISALWVIIVAVLSAVITEGVLQKFSSKKISILDGSAALTGLLLAYNLPSGVPLWIPVAGSAFAIFIGKFVFGGLGKNIFNPALAGRAFLMASWPGYMTAFSKPFSTAQGVDVVTTATPLMLLKEKSVLGNINYLDLFIGNRGGCIGEVCIIALLLGVAFLFIKKYISWHIPLTFIATVGVFTFIFGKTGLFTGDWLLQILSGGLILGAFFMATDYVTSPLTYKGQIIFGFGCGCLTAIIRLWGGYPEGVCYAILIMNAVVPLIDRYTRSRIYGVGTVLK